MFKNRIGGQKQGLNAGELAIDQRHAQFGLVIAVLTQSFDDDGGADLLAVVGDQAIGGGDDDVGAAGFLQRAANYLDSRAFGNIGVFAALTATTTCTSSKNRAERSITSKCPAVTGSYEPGHTAIVMPSSLPLSVRFTRLVTQGIMMDCRRNVP